MNRRHAARAICGVAVLLGCLFTVHVPANDKPGLSGISIGVVAKDRKTGQSVSPAPTLSRVTYEVAVYGGMAVGTLSQEFANEVDADLTATYEATLGGGARFASLALEERGRLRELSAKFTAESPEGESRAAAARSTVPSLASRHALRATLRRELQALQPGTPEASDALVKGPGRVQVQSQPFEIEDQGEVAIVSRFQTRLALDGRLFKLRLPAVHDTAQRAINAAGDGLPEPIPARIVVTVHHDQPLWELRSESHEILADFVGDRTIIETVEAETRADRAFELEFALGREDDPTLASYVRKGANGLHEVEALLTPPEKPQEGSARPKELLFIMDSSGSMRRHDKMDQARRAVLWCIGRLGEKDRFNIVEFDADYHLMNPKLLAAAEIEKSAISDWLDSVKADGGTHLLPALKAALVLPHDPERHREIVVVTDGILADEKDVLGLLEEELDEGRLFVVGTGPDVRQDTLLRLAEYGRGAATFASEADGLELAIAELFDAISQPLGWDVELDWAGADVEEVLPSRLPDLYAGRPVRVLAWVRGDIPETLRVRMTATDGNHLYEVKLPPRLP